MDLCVTESSGESDSSDDSDIEGETASALFMVNCVWLNRLMCLHLNIDCVHVLYSKLQNITQPPYSGVNYGISFHPSFRKSARLQNVEVGADPQAAPGLAAGPGPHP